MKTFEVGQWVRIDDTDTVWRVDGVVGGLVHLTPISTHGRLVEPERLAEVEPDRPSTPSTARFDEAEVIAAAERGDPLVIQGRQYVLDPNDAWSTQ